MSAILIKYAIGNKSIRDELESYIHSHHPIKIDQNCFIIRDTKTASELSRWLEEKMILHRHKSDLVFMIEVEFPLCVSYGSDASSQWRAENIPSHLRSPKVRVVSQPDR